MITPEDTNIIEGEFDFVSREPTQDEVDEQAHKNAAMFNPALQLVLLPENPTPSDAIHVLSKQIPENEYGLPTMFYRVDMLPYELGNLTQQDAEACGVPITYEEGYPTFDRGHLFWQQLPGEPYQEFILFQRYLDQAMETGLRQLQMLAMENKVTLAKVHSLAQTYYWRWRARAHDLFEVAADRKRRELRARKIEHSHFGIAEDLLRPLKAKFQDPNFFETLSSKEAVEVLRLLINIQRVSSGLAQNGNAGATNFNPDSAVTPTELMRQITEGAQTASGGLGLDSNLTALLTDPNFAMEAQALVIRVRHGNVNGGQVKVDSGAIQHDA